VEEKLGLICPHCGNSDIVRGEGPYFRCVVHKGKVEHNLYGLPLNSGQIGCGYCGYEKEFFSVEKPVFHEEPIFEESEESLRIYIEPEIPEETLRSLGIVEEVDEEE
jgi:hypothetical protein